MPWKISLPVGFWSNAPAEYEYDNFINSDETNDIEKNEGHLSAEENTESNGIQSILGKDEIEEENGKIDSEQNSHLNGDVLAGNGGVGENTSGVVVHKDYFKHVDVKLMLTISQLQIQQQHIFKTKITIQTLMVFIIYTKKF